MRSDPTRTTSLRRKFVAEMVRRFKAVSKAINELFIEDMVIGNAETWVFQTDAQKVQSFRQWLNRQVNSSILTTDAVGKPWTSKYIESAYRKGAVRSYIDSRKILARKYPEKYVLPNEEFLMSSFSGPETLSKVELLYTRAFTELEGVTAAMDQQLSRTLADGLSAGVHPDVIAGNLTKNVTKLTRTRANVIARTEIIRAHAEGQLDSFEILGVEDVGVQAEWSTAGDERVCALCGDLEGTVMPVKDAHGMLPLHPNCRCAWIPSLVKG